MTRFISIVSTEKSTGKTTVALNLGLALHKMNQKVVVFDADFSKPNMLSHLDVNYLPVTLENVFNGENHLFDCIYKHPSGLKIIPSMIMKDYEKLRYNLQDLMVDYDYVILDTPFDREEVEEVLKNSNEGIIVHSPENSSKVILDAANLLKKHKTFNLGIILNRSHPGSVNSIFEMPVIAKIPNHNSVLKSFEMKHPVLYTHPTSLASKEFLRLGKMLSSD